MRWLLIALLCLPLVSGLEITEIMYDPLGSDNNREYIEVFTNGTNLTDVLVEDLASSDTLTLVQASDSPYALIVEEGFNETGINASLYSVGKTIGNGLNNDRDLVLLRDTKSVLDAYFYVAERDGASNNGKALCRDENLFRECTPSPGEENDLNQTVIAQNYSLMISEFLPDPEGYDTASKPNGEWVELYNTGDQAVDIRGLILEDKGNHTVIISGVQIDKPVLQSKEYGVVYLNGQTLLNNEGYEELKLRSSSTVLDEVSYSFSREGLSWSKDFTTSTFFLTLPTPGQPYHKEIVSLNSSLVLEKVYTGEDQSVQFGDMVRVRLKAYRGDSDKTQIKLFVENISKQQLLTLDQSYKEHVFTLSIPLLSNCQHLYPDGSYTLTAEGFDTRITVPLHVKGIAKENCVFLGEKSLVENMTAVTGPRSLASAKKIPAVKEISSDIFINRTERVVYESSDYKARRLAVYFFCLTLIFVIMAILSTEG